MTNVEENFEQEGKPVKWSPLAESTKKQREKKGKLGKILQVSGQLATANQPSHTRTRATVSNNQFNAPIHNFGGRTGKGGKAVIPAGPFMVLTKPDQDDIEDVLRVILDNL